MASPTGSLPTHESGFVQTTPYGSSSEHNSGDVELHEFEQTVAEKHMGTEADKRDMRMMGRAQVLRVKLTHFSHKRNGIGETADAAPGIQRNFSFISIFGFGAVLICTWEILFANLIFALTDGGTGGLFWGYTVTVIASVFIYLSISEIASMSPTAGGQYHWVSEFSPRWCQKYLSYITGWLLATGWQGSVVGLSFLAGTIIQGLITLNNASYEPQQWHGILLVIAVVAFAIIFNTSLARQLPLIEGVMLVMHVIGLFAICVPLWVLAPRNTAEAALLEFTNGGNWPTMGVSFMIGLLTSLGSMLGFDCAVHMSEEVKNASRDLPRAIMWSVAVNAVLGYITVLTLCFTISDATALLNGTTGYPFIQLFYDVTNNYVGADIMVTIVVVTLISAVISEIATASRQIWSFARDNGLPFSPWLRKVSPGWKIPLNAVWVSFLSGVAIAFINLGSSVALNAIVSLTLSALLASYILSIGCFLTKRLRRDRLPPAGFSLGKYGLVINIIALVFLLSFFVFCYFPTSQPVTAQTMNWSCAMFGGIILFATLYYVVTGRHQYIPPVNIQNRSLRD